MPKTAILLAAAVAFGGALLPGAAPAATGGVPTIDSTASCHGAMDGLAATGGAKGQDRSQDKAQVQSCLDSEARIRKELTDNWPRYSAASRSQCSNELAHAYHASYVELISCLEMANPNVSRPKPVN